jgi:hypothetical protein
MYTRFLLALAIAASILMISAVTRASAASRESIVRFAANSHAQTVASAHAGVTLLPTVIVRPDPQARLVFARGPGGEEATLTVPTAALDDAGHALAGKVKERVARVSMLVPYYAFGGARSRSTE